MYNILTLNKIAAIGTSRLGDNYKYVTMFRTLTQFL